MPKLFDYTDNRKGRQLGTSAQVHWLSDCMGMTEDGKLIYEYVTTSNLRPSQGRIHPYKYEVQRLTFAMFDGDDENGNPTFKWHVVANEGTTSQLEKQRLYEFRARNNNRVIA